MNKPGSLTVIIGLVVAGEIIFGLPFHIARFFRPTMLGVFGLTNAELGDAIAIYGVTAMISYFPSGLIADRFSARKLMSFSLFATALGGVWLSAIPGKPVLFTLFGFWGITTILLFWSAMIRATREWGGKFAQGRAFGFLDGGRGLVAAGVASLGVFLLAAFLPDQLENMAADERTEAFKIVIWFYTALTFGASIFVWFVVPDTKAESLNPNPFRGIKSVLKNRSTWLIALVVVSAYCGFKALDFYGLYAVDILGMNEVEAARFVSNASYLRPVAAIGAGFLADRFTARKTISGSFLILIIAYLLLLFFTGNLSGRVFIISNLLFTFAAVYALRGVYFALIEESNVPRSVTGTTVGVVSFLGFTPDIFFNSVAGRILDTFPGAEGYHNFFLFLGMCAIAGLIVSLLITRKNKSIKVEIKNAGG